MAGPARESGSRLFLKELAPDMKFYSICVSPKTTTKVQVPEDCTLRLTQVKSPSPEPRARLGSRDGCDLR